MSWLVVSSLKGTQTANWHWINVETWHRNNVDLALFCSTN